MFFLNIGNTHTQVAELADGKLKLLATHETSSLGAEIPLLKEHPEAHGIAVCVVPPLRERLQRQYSSRLRFLSWQDFKMLDFSQVDTSTLGLDRIANAAAAFSLAGGPAIVVDCGTCLNTVVVDGEGRFLGGAILPGRCMMRRALHEYTAQLPMLELRDCLPLPIGRNTLDAMAAGTDLAGVGALRELLSRTQQQVHGKYKVFATGGDASYFLKALPEIMDAAPPLLTLLGVKLAWDALR